MTKPLEEDELLNALKSEAEAACGYYDTTIYEEQAEAIRYYDGQPFGDELEGLSQIVLKDVAESVDYMTISVGRLFVSGDKVCEFEATDKEDAEGADQATAALDRLFMQDQDGYRVIMDWLKAGLIEKYCVCKTAVVEEESVKTSVFIAESEEQLALAPEDAEITDNGDGTFKVKVKQTITKTRFYDYPLPSEEFRFSARARHEDDADYLAHVSRKTRSELVEMGFDVDTVYELSTEDELMTDLRRAARDDYQNWRDDKVNASMEEVTLWEEYIRIDADGDGIAERLKVFRVAEKILSVEEVDDHPFVVFTPFPRPHRIVGDGLADKTMDIQRIRSVVARQLMNGMYLSNMPRFWVPNESVTSETYNDLLTVIPGSPVRGKGAAPVALNAGFEVGKSLNVLEFWTGERESRTGITRMNQGLDADALNKTATGTAMMQAQGQQFEEYIARNFGECFARLMWKKLRLVKEHGAPFSLKMDGEYVEVDPATWPDEPDMIIRVGMGTGSKEKRLALRLNLLEIQREGLDIGMVKKEHLFNNAAAIVKDAGLGQPDDYFVNPAKPELDENGQPVQEQPRPDPEMAKVEAEAQLQAQKLQGEQAMSSAKMQMMQQEAGLKLQLQREEAEAQAQLARDKATFEAQQAEQRFAFEQEMAARQFQQDSMLAQQRADDDAKMKKYREGGDLDK